MSENLFPVNRSVRNSFNGRQISATVDNQENKFRDKSRDVIRGHILRISEKGFEYRTSALSNTTIASSLKLLFMNFRISEGEYLCCCSILSNPIISTSFPLESRTIRSYSLVVAYFLFNASRNEVSPSVFFPGLMKDPAPVTLQLANGSGNCCAGIWGVTELRSIHGHYDFRNVFLAMDRPIQLLTRFRTCLLPAQRRGWCRGTRKLTGASLSTPSSSAVVSNFWWFRGMDWSAVMRPIRYSWKIGLLMKDTYTILKQILIKFSGIHRDWRCLTYSEDVRFLLVSNWNLYCTRPHGSSESDVPCRTSSRRRRPTRPKLRALHNAVRRLRDATRLAPGFSRECADDPLVCAPFVHFGL